MFMRGVGARVVWVAPGCAITIGALPLCRSFAPGKVCVCCAAAALLCAGEDAAVADVFCARLQRCLRTARRC